MMQEGNTGHMPPTVWAEWRLWLYSPAPSEDILGQAGPSGAGLITELKPITHGGSTAFGNPSFRVVPCPGSAAALDSVEARRCVFVSFFAFGEGAAQVRAALQQRPPPPPPGKWRTIWLGFPYARFCSCFVTQIEASHGPAAQGEAGVVAFVSAAPPEEASAGVV
jgi:hypothetical protein